MTKTDDEEQPLGAVTDDTARDAAIHLRRQGLDSLADAVDDLILQHEATSNSERRLLEQQGRDDDRLRVAEQKAKLVDELVRENADLVVFDRQRQRVLSVDEIRDRIEGREPARDVEQQVQQHVSLLGGNLDV